MLVIGRVTVPTSVRLPELRVPRVLCAGQVTRGEAWHVCPGPRTQDDVIRYAASQTCSFGGGFLTAGTGRVAHSSPGSLLSPRGPAAGEGNVGPTVWSS